MTEQTFEDQQTEYEKLQALKEGPIGQLVRQIIDQANSISNMPNDFNKVMSIQHRTNQQSFTRLCAAWLEHCASEEYLTDQRNQGSKDFAQSIKTLLKEKNGYDIPLSAYLNNI